LRLIPFDLSDGRESLRCRWLGAEKIPEKRADLLGELLSAASAPL